MNKTRKRSFTALIITLAALLVLVLSLGIFCACGANSNGKNSAGAWLQGESAPTAEFGKDGDHYFDTETLTAYTMKNGEWVPTNLYKGTGVPDNSQGEEGDLYLDTAGGVLYEKGTSVWSIVLKLKGEPGRAGVMWFSGDEVPEDIKDAQAGDFYLQNGTFDVYQLQSGGSWEHLGTLKGTPGTPAKDPAQFYNGKGAPEGNPAITEDPQEGDIYLGIFDGDDDKGAGFRLYRYNGTEWETLMESITKDRLDIYTLEQLISFAEKVSEGKDYQGKEVHLKTEIDFNGAEGASLRRALARAAAWTPIGTEQHPFRGTFDGEGHTISNFSVDASSAEETVGFFGYVEGATIQHLHFEKAEVSASGSGVVAAVVVGEVKGSVSFNDVTVEVTCDAQSDAKVGSLVGKATDAEVKVENVTADITGETTPAGGNEGSSLVADGEVTFEGENVIEYPIAEGFIEKHYKNGEETTVICEITSLNGLKAFRDSVNGTGDFAGKADTYAGKTVKLLDDIDFSDEPEHPEDKWYSIRWIPIGKSESPFSGTFDGQGHILKNLSKDYSNNKGAAVFIDFGLFAKTGDGATFRNFTLENVTMLCRTDSASNHTQSVAAVVASPGTNNSFSNIHVVGNIAIKGSWYVGGIVGYGNTGMTIDNCEVNGNGEKGGTITLECTYAGGIVGFVQTGTRLTNNVVKNITFEMHENPNHPNKDSAVGAVGGISGIAHAGCVITGSTVENVVFNFRDGAELKDAGAVAGIYLYSATSATTISDNHGNVEMYDHTKEFPITKMYNYGLVGEERNYSSDKNFIMENNNFSIKFQGLPYNTTTKEWSISSQEELEAFRDLVNGGMKFEGETVVLTGDINIGGEDWTPMEEFAGTFKGETGTEEIRGLTINTDDGSEYTWGFFSLLKGTVEGVVFEEVDISAQNAQGVGAVAAKCENATISNVKVHIKEGRSIEGYQWVGGLVGYATSLTAKGNEVSGSIKYLHFKAGGLVGLILSTGNVLENNRLHDLTISAVGDWDYIGGLIGGTSKANDGVTMNRNTFENVTLDGSNAAYTQGGDIGALMGNVGEGPYYSNGNSGTVTVNAKSGTNLHHKGLWGRDSANLDNSSNPDLTVIWNGVTVTEKGYALETVDHLIMFRDWVNGGNTFEGETVVLTADVNLEDIPNWTPIGSTNAHPFMGTFMGGKITDGEIVPEVHTISNLTIKKTGTEEGLADANDKKFAAFFAFTNGDVTISDLHFVKANVTNSYSESDGAAGYCAVLVGRTNGGNLEIKNVTIGEKFDNTEADKLAHAKETPYVTSGKAVAAFVSRSTGGGSITFDNCINYANLCAPKAAGFIAQFHSNAGTPLTITNSANYGNITMPQTKEELCYSPDVVMGGFIGYNQNANSIVLINCENNGDITASCNYYVGKANVGGLISSVRNSTGSMLVDCINRGNITVDIQDTTVTCNFEIGGLTGSGGATMYHVEQFGDITVSTICNAQIYVGGVSGNEDKGNLHMKNRSGYEELPVPEKGSRVERYDSDEYAGVKPKLEEHSNIVYCDITVTCPDAANAKVGGATGQGHVNDTIDSTYVSIYAFVNGENLHDKTFGHSLVLGGMTGAAEYSITNSVLRIAAIPDRGMECAVYWDAEGN